MPTSTPEPPSGPGWHSDPFDPELIRYSDGSGWTRHTQLMPHGWTGSPSKQSSVAWWQTWWAVVPALFLCAPLGLIGLWRRPGLSLQLRSGLTAACVLLFGAALAADGSSTDGGTPSSAAVRGSSDAVPPLTPPTPTSPSLPLPTASPEPAMSTVPRMLGESHQQARKSLLAAGLVIDGVDRVPSAQPRGTVLRQSTRPGRALEVGSGVSVSLAAPYPRAPAVAGSTRASASRALARAGFEVTFVTETVTSGREGIALRQVPPADDRLEPGTVVTVVLAAVVKPVAAPPPSDSCTSGYAPCLAPAADYDCAGGSGDGPAYANGPIRVTGSDPYDLDADGDGVACDA